MREQTAYSWTGAVHTRGAERGVYRGVARDLWSAAFEPA